MITLGPTTTATLDIDAFCVDLKANPCWRVPHPGHGGDLRPVKAMEFADGSRVELTDTGFEVKPVAS
ncbi:hypothetical protein [Roseospira visakhapatnamensis]|uniref:Uncharacterized protein n=1 Tax=Roseospira visakhapatnamensis TaxID=390880 RepID=A0A7W6RFT5_9PROT|nr:hypothetical protein [Roseospira visakhapatnamensis]MBB4267728.1 hypothetical protein [Roseospira visakhapatnamensis]